MKELVANTFWVGLRTGALGCACAAAVLVVACAHHEALSVPTLTCPADDPTCFLEGLTITEDGQPVELVDVPLDALAAADGGVFSAPGTPPQITSTPGPLTLSGGDASPLDLDYSDPTASRPAFFITIRPAGGFQCFQPCCLRCRATRRRRDGAVRGTAHYEVASANAAATTSHGVVVIYPVSSTGPADPVDIVGGGGDPGTLLTGSGTQLPLQVNPPPNPGGSGSGGGPGGSSSGGSGGGPGSCSCANDGQCAAFGATNCSMPGALNNGGVCDVGGDQLCHCCYGTCGIDQTGAVSGCSCFGCNSACSSQLADRCIGTTCAVNVGACP
jgi:hypothetical protein